MKQPNLHIVLALSVLGICHQASAQGTSFTYQGRLNDAGSPATGLYDLRFRAWDSEVNGAPASTTLTYTVPITNGLFTVILNFGSGVFTGESRWLEMSVSTNGAGAFTTLLPRQPMSATPYAITAASVSGSVAAGQLSGALSPAQLPASVVTNNSSNLTLAGTFAGNGAGVSNVNAAALGGFGATNFWQLGGNNVRPGQFLGSTNYEAVELKVNNARALRLEPRANTAMYANTVTWLGGSQSNSVTYDACGSVIAGGGGSYIGVHAPNSVAASYAFIGAGAGNLIGSGADFATLGGGYSNTILANATYAVLGGGERNSVDAYRAFLGGGRENTIMNDAIYSVLGGGYGNTIRFQDYYSVLAGGYWNSIGDSSGWSFIGGGYSNSIRTGGWDAFLGGGQYNTIQTNAGSSVLVGGKGNAVGTNALYSFLGGGVSNRVSAEGAVVVGGGADMYGVNKGNTASGLSSVVVGGTQNLAGGSRSTVGGGHNNSATNAYATVPGGAWNLAGGQGGFAAGRAAKSLHDGSFVWNDNSSGDFVSTAANQFLVHAGAGVGINTNNPNGAALNVNGSVRATSFVGGGDNLTSLNASQLTGTIADARLSANVARLNANQTFAGQNTFQNLVQMQANVFMNDRDIHFRSDLFHGVGWYGAGKTFAGLNVDGPALYGNNGGVLGSRTASATNAALSWTGAGGVGLDPLAANSGSLLPGLTFGGNSGEGISSKRTAGTGQYGLDFYANYARRMRIGNNGNVGINTDNPQSTLHVNGTATVDANLKLPVTTAGAGILYFGANTFLHGYGDYNFFAGQSAGNLTMSGWGNVGTGWEALTDNVSGDFNTAAGYAALAYNTTGDFNSASGSLALAMNTNGTANTADGYMALYNNTRGCGNTASGLQALWNNTTGSRNIALGHYAGYNLTTGSNNICIANDGTAADNATIRIGTVGTQTKTFVAGIYGTTASGGSAVYVNSSGQLGTVISSRRFKTDIQDLGDPGDTLLALRPVTFRYLPEIDPQGLPQFGLIAEEVEQVNPDLVVHDEQGRPYTVRYEAVNAILLQQVLKEHRKVQELEARLEKLETLVRRLSATDN